MAGEGKGGPKTGQTGRTDRARVTRNSGRRVKPEKWDAFLELVREGNAIRHACLDVGIGRDTVYSRRKRDQAFADAMDEAFEEGGDVIEQEAFRRGIHGVERPVHYLGQRVDTVTEYSDQVLLFLLKGRKPERYGDRAQLRLGGQGGAVEIKLTFDPLGESST